MQRAIRYLGHHPVEAALPFIFLLIATLAQLAVPHMVSNILDAVTRGVIANAIVPKLSQIPTSVLPTLLTKLNTTVDQLQSDYANAERLLFTALIEIVIFAIVRGVFAFLQVYWAERNSQSAAYDMRNDLFAKIQRLSFSYHDRNQTGQLMIRATDDVEKVRLFIGQGLVVALQSVVLLVATLLVLWFTNPALTLVILPILPIAFSVFFVFGRMAQPLFTRVQIKLSALNTVLQENLAGIRVIKAFAREPEEQVRFRTAADAVLAQQLKVARIFRSCFR